MAKEKGESKEQILTGFKCGLGFWLSGLALWLLASAVAVLLYYLL